MKTLIFTLLLTFSVFNQTATLEAAALHAILIGDTKDSSLGTAFFATVQKMQSKAAEISKQTGLSLTTYVFIENDARIDNVMDTVKNLKIEPDDVVLVYFAIHGYRNRDKTNPWPSLYFGVEARGLDFHFVNKTILKKHPRFLLSIADSCNSFVNYHFPTVEKSLPQAAPYSPEFIRENYNRLFMDAQGSVIVSSSQPGEYSWAYPAMGGLWSLEFFTILQKTVETDKSPSWLNIMNTISKNIISTRVLQKGAIQTAQYEVIVN